MFCNAQFPANLNSSKTNSMRLAAGDLTVNAAGKNSGATTAAAGTNTLDSYVTLSSSTITEADANGWYSFVCQGYRSTEDTTSTLTAMMVHDTITYRAGFKYYATSQTAATIAKSDVLASDYTYTLLDGAVALSVSVATVVAMSVYTF